MTSTGDEQVKEREQRWQRVREFLQNKELDALVVAGPSSHTSEPLDRYLSNWIPGCIVVFPLEGNPTLLNPFVPQLLAFSADTPDEELPWIRDIRSGARGSSVVTVLQEKGLEQGRIGVVGLSGMRSIGPRGL